MKTDSWWKVIVLAAILALLGTNCAQPVDDGGDAGAGDELCGNGVVDPGEECDDGNRIAHDGCSPQCRWEVFCGNGRVEPGEECDDGNLKDGDGCSSQCTVEKGCGNGILEVGEQCDDNNLEDGDGCSADCIDEDGVATCGNGILEWGEGCDDGNLEDGDGCSSTCQREDGCGNGKQEPGEQCDDGNNVSGDGCSANCKMEFICGDHQCSKDQGESCELCPRDCCPDCGNGTLDEGEQCDDGNNVPGDGCSAGCKDEDGVATCGNGILEQGEQCDPGLEVEGASCADDCTWAWICGDSVCSTDAGESCELCPRDCCPSCGNGIVDGAAEVCDGTDFFPGLSCEYFGYDGGQLACTAYCTPDFTGCTGTGPVCGNGVVEYGEECDGTHLGGANCAVLGYASGTLFCNNQCRFDTSGCSDQVVYFRENFDDSIGLVARGWDFSGSWRPGWEGAGDPMPSFSGRGYIGTNPGGKAPNNVAYTAANEAVSPEFFVPSDSTPMVVVWAWCDISHESGDDEGWILEYSVDGGANWFPVSDASPVPDKTVGGRRFWNSSCTKQWRPFVGYMPGARGHNVRVRVKAIFDHSVYSSNTRDTMGVYIDEMVVGTEGSMPIFITNPSRLGRGMPDREVIQQISVWGGSGDYDYLVINARNAGWLNLDPNTGLLSGTPTATDIGLTELLVRVTDRENPVRTTLKRLYFEVLDVKYFEDFESGATGWTTEGEWEIGTPTSGPSAAYSGTKCVGTNLDGNYSNDQDWTCVFSPSIDLTGTTSPHVLFYGWMQTESSYDGVVLMVRTTGSGTGTQVGDVDPPYQEQVDGNSVWAWSGYAEEWLEYSADISSYAGQTVQIGWCFYSDGSVTKQGFYFDDVMIVDQ